MPRGELLEQDEAAMPALDLDVGQTATRSMHVTAEHIRAYAELSGTETLFTSMRSS